MLGQTGCAGVSIGRGAFYNPWIFGQTRHLLATGERLFTRWQFKELLQEGVADIVQPDVTKVGGLSEQRRIAWMAEEFGVKYVGHGWNTALGVAAALQLATALRNVDLVEFIGGSPYVDGITAEPFRLACSQCHVLPDPARHTATEWPAVVARMERNMEWMNRVVGSRPVKGEPQLRVEEINAFLARHARK